MQQTWDPGRSVADLNSVTESLSKMQSSLSSWDRDVFGSVKRKVASLKQELEDERTNTLYQGPTAREKNLMDQLSEALAREEIMERQRSRVEWLREGDRNGIHALKNTDGELVVIKNDWRKWQITFTRACLRRRLIWSLISFVSTSQGRFRKQ